MGFKTTLLYNLQKNKISKKFQIEMSEAEKQKIVVQISAVQAPTL